MLKFDEQDLVFARALKVAFDDGHIKFDQLSYLDMFNMLKTVAWARDLETKIAVDLEKTGAQPNPTPTKTEPKKRAPRKKAQDGESTDKG